MGNADFHQSNVNVAGRDIRYVTKIAGDASMSGAMAGLPQMALHPGAAAVVGKVASKLVDSAKAAMLSAAANPDMLGLFDGMY
jgi:hypothetical protein